MLDSLDHHLAETENLLDIDHQTIASRTELIETHLRLIKMHLNEQITGEFGMQLTKYKGVKKVYSRFLSDYDDCKHESSALRTQANNLRLAVGQRQIEKDSFKVYYAREKMDAMNNLNKARKLIQPLHAVEPDYQRISILVDEKLNTMAKTDSTLYHILHPES